MKTEELARFEEKVHHEPMSGCWLWAGAWGSRGYGQMRIAGKMVKAHRFSYEHFVGPIPSGLVIDHKCRVHCCVNPDHLEPVTSKENTMRGDTVARFHSEKTTCARGHSFVKPAGSKQRFCRECRRAANVRYRAKQNGGTIGCGNSKKAVCKLGHVLVSRQGAKQRWCQTCRNVANVAYRARKKNVAAV